MLPTDSDPRVFGDYLLSLGIKSRIDESANGWAVWIRDEDQVAKGAEELKAYLDDPKAHRFVKAASDAKAIKQAEEKREREYRKNFRDVSDQWSGLQARRRPLTIFLIATAAVVFLLQQSGYRGVVLNTLSFTTSHLELSRGWIGDGLKPIQSGQVWRLITPIFLHFGPLHILFNGWVMMIEGTLIEKSRGTLRFGVLVLISAIVSNLGQYLYMAQGDPNTTAAFGGLSGVGYALFGYIWMKTLYEPEQGMILPPNTVAMMLIWLVLCMTGVLGPIANAAHVVGLVVGVVFGLLRY